MKPSCHTCLPQGDRKYLWGGGPRKPSQASFYMSHILCSHLFSHQDALRSSCACSWILSLYLSSPAVWEGADQHKPTNPGRVRLSSWLSPQSLMQNSLSAMPRHENFHPTLFQFISGCCGDQFKWNSSILKENMSLSHLPCKVPG